MVQRISFYSLRILEDWFQSDPEHFNAEEIFHGFKSLFRSNPKTIKIWDVNELYDGMDLLDIYIDLPEFGQIYTFTIVTPSWVKQFSGDAESTSEGDLNTAFTETYIEVDIGHEYVSADVATEFMDRWAERWFPDFTSQWIWEQGDFVLSQEETDPEPETSLTPVILLTRPEEDRTEEFMGWIRQRDNCTAMVRKDGLVRIRCDDKIVAAAIRSVWDLDFEQREC